MSLRAGLHLSTTCTHPGIPRMNFVSLTERMPWEAERQILHHQLIDTARTSSQYIIQNAALEREFLPSCGISKCQESCSTTLHGSSPSTLDIRECFFISLNSTYRLQQYQPLLLWLRWEQTILVWIVLISFPVQFLVSKASIAHQDLFHLMEALTSHNRHVFSLSFGELRDLLLLTCTLTWNTYRNILFKIYTMFYITN